MKNSSTALLLSLLLLAATACAPKAQRFPKPAGQATIMHHEDYDLLLTRYLNEEGDVDYAAWQKNKDDVAQLDRYLGRMTAAPPAIEPALYKSQHDELSYWINLYNALVVREVVRRWPLKSVRDYQPTLTSKIDTTKGFFRDLRFVIGAKEMSLDDIEHQTIRKQFSDARIHFALNCGSSSCPVLGASAYTGEGLEAELQRATLAFINQSENLRVDLQKERVYLNKIFKWYREDFERHAKDATGKGSANALDFVALFAEGKLAKELELARSQSFKIVYSDYSWAVNQGQAKTGDKSDLGTTPSKSKAGPAKVSGARRQDFEKMPLPPLDLSLLSGERVSQLAGKPMLISFWATYCMPCRQSMPHLQALAAEHKDTLQVLALSADDSQAKVEDFLSERNIDLPVAMGSEVATLMSQLKVRGLPTEVFVDADGAIRFTLSGAATNSQLDQAVAELLAY